MAKASKPKNKSEGVTAAGLVEALEQDVELSMEQVKDAVVAVEEKLGVRKSSKPKRKPSAAKTSKLTRPKGR